MARQRAGIQSGDAGNIIAGKIAIQLLFAAVVGRAARNRLHNESRGPGPAALRVLFIDSVVAHQGISHGHALSCVGRVGQHFEITCHCGIEHHFAHNVSVRADAPALKDRAVLQDEICFHASLLRSLFLCINIPFPLINCKGFWPDNALLTFCREIASCFFKNAAI